MNFLKKIKCKFAVKYEIRLLSLKVIHYPNIALVSPAMLKSGVFKVQRDAGMKNNMWMGQGNQGQHNNEAEANLFCTDGGEKAAARIMSFRPPMVS